MNKLTVFSYIIFVMLVTSCGFTPIYGTRNQSLPIKISSVSTFDHEFGKLDFIMKQSLKDAFNPLGEYQNIKYNIEVTLRKNVLSFATQSTSINTRNRVNLIAQYIVTDVNGVKVIEDKVEATDSYEIAVSPYSTLVSDEEITVLLAKTLAQEIALRIAAEIHTKVS